MTLSEDKCEFMEIQYRLEQTSLLFRTETGQSRNQIETKPERKLNKIKTETEPSQNRTEPKSEQNQNRTKNRTENFLVLF